MIDILFGERHAAYILAAYLATLLTLGGVALHVLWTARQRRKRLRELEG